MKQNSLNVWPILAAIMITTSCFAQQQNKITGIYKTADDYVHHILSYTITAGAKNCYLKVNDFLPSSTVVIKKDGEKFILNKKEIFGYQACNNKNYRFYNSSAYEIVDSAGFYIYKRLVANNSHKAAYAQTTYFFSKTNTGAVQLLTQHNLEYAFADNAKFRHAVENVPANEKLVEYDKYDNTYEVKYLFFESLK